jgi:glycosyltransferase involved in cell wall biosynthesis
LPTRLKLTIDIAPLFEPQWTGIPVFTRRLIESLQRSRAMDLAFSYNLSAIPPALVAQTLRAGTGTFLRTTFDRHHDHAIIDPAIPLLFPSVKTAFGVTRREASVVHDMSTLFMPENHEPANVAYHLDNLAEELASNDVTFCVSDATAASLAAAFPSTAAKRRTLYQFADWPPEFPIMDHNLPIIGLGRYAVVVGTIEPRKNLSLLIDSLPLPELTRTNLRFIVIGRKGWKVDEFMTGFTPAQRSKIIFSGFVSEFTKYRLIRHAEFMVFPSLYEGFGIPALEAMSLGKPVLAARTSSLPEVIGDAGLYFDPLSTTDFAAALAEMENPARQSEFSVRALKNAKAFNWRRMAQPVIEWLKS